MARSEVVPTVEASLRTRFDATTVNLIRDTVARGVSDAELHMFLELCARYQLDPFAGQIYAVRIPGRNGGQGRVVIMASRDGFLAIANRHDDFLGLESDVIRQGDTFLKRQTPQGPEVQHEYGVERGAIVAAWALVHRRERPPTYFYAPFDEYTTGINTWKDYPSAMAKKVAESVALRMAFNISGLVGEDEMARQLAEGVVEGDVSEEIDWGEDPAVAERLRLLVAEANRVRPDAFRPAMLAMKLRGMGDEQRVEFCRELEAFVAAQQ